MMKKYFAQLKSRKQLEEIKASEGYTDAWGWWADICPGEKVLVRDATKEDLARCSLRDGCSMNPDDWVCEVSGLKSLISRSAIESLMHAE